MNRQPDRAALLCNRPRDPLTDPPIRIGAELVAAGRVELLHTPHQTNGSLLDQIQQLHVPLGVFLGDAHHQAQVRRHHPLLGAAARLQLALQLHRAQSRRFGQLRRRHRFPATLIAQFRFLRFQIHQLLHLTAQGDLLLVAQQRYTADVPQIGAHQVRIRQQRQGRHRLITKPICFLIYHCLKDFLPGTKPKRQSGSAKAECE